ncbi:MAG: VOC family protein [Actinomycetota bacterium]|nr:VOC family protein [Actinomycetota bacterium]
MNEGRSAPLTTIELGDDPSAWSAAGFTVTDDTVVLGGTTVALTGAGGGFRGWAFAGLDPLRLDGLPDSERSDGPLGDGPDGDGPAHPNGIVSIDHVVVRTGDCDRTVAAFEQAGFEVRGGRSTTSYGAPMRQTFFWAGDVIVELVGPDAGEPTTDEPTSIFGLALVATDLDATAEHLGDLMGAPKDAVQDGRRIAGLRHRQVGISLPIAVMSPHVRRS